MLPNIPLNPVPENRELLHSHSPFPSMLCECVCAVGAEGENPVQRRLLPSTREGEAYIISQEGGGQRRYCIAHDDEKCKCSHIGRREEGADIIFPPRPDRPFEVWHGGGGGGGGEK